MRRRKGEGWRRFWSHSVSLCAHGAVLAWVAAGPFTQDAEPAKSLYEQVIQPNEKKIVWYRLAERLPEIAPARPRASRQPPRAERPNPQVLVSEGSRRGSQAVWLPEPPIELKQDLQAPNLVAFEAPPRPPAREFTLPPAHAAPQAELPEAPRVAAALDYGMAPLPLRIDRPQPRAFTPPPLSSSRAAPQVELPAAPRVAAALDYGVAPLPLRIDRPQPRAFTPPLLSSSRAAPQVELPAAPPVAAALDYGMAPLPLRIDRPQPRAFTPPPLSSSRAAPQVELPAAPPVAAPLDYSLAPMPIRLARPQPRAFTPPPDAAPVRGSLDRVAAPPPLTAPPVESAALASMAIAGLKPAPPGEIPRPEGARQAEFSAGPKLRPAGGMGDASGALIAIPGLLARGAEKDAQPTLVARAARVAPTSVQNLMAALRDARPSVVDDPETRGAALRVSSAPDPLLEGRVVYTMAVQMPNVTSFSGSWLIWFAERQPEPGAAPFILPPIPLRKVDPKYIAAAADERVEGKVRLAAVIGRDGRVASVTLLQHLDARLDRSAGEALAKWEFEPARRNGVTIDVDAVVEIPFRLAPRGPAK